MKLPLNDKDLSFYNARLKKSIETIIQDFKSKKVELTTANAATGTQLTQKLGIAVSTGAPDKNNILVPDEFFIYTNSSLLPAMLPTLLSSIYIENCSSPPEEA